LSYDWDEPVSFLPPGQNPRILLTSRPVQERKRERERELKTKKTNILPHRFNHPPIEEIAFPSILTTPFLQIYISALNPADNISARRAHTAIRQLAAGFRALGLQRGECVCIHSFNDIWYPIFFLGVVAAGGVYAGTNPVSEGRV
jgi:acyl-CoA synthetase (AMP-forming)/AMP-acid ligase II